MARVVIYDSGVGGLSIFKEVQAVCPDLDYLFLSDNQCYPYGTKSEEELLERVSQVAEAVVKQFNPDLLILACNTASTVCLPSLRQSLNIPVVGVVPAIKPAAKISTSKVIGLLATPATVARAYTDELIAEFAEDCQIVKVGSSELVDMAEDFLSGISVDSERLEQILQPLWSVDQLDTLVLACTHFPLLKTQIQEVMAAKGLPVQLIDSGAAIAKRVEHLLNCENGTKVNGPSNGSAMALLTQLDYSPSFVESLKRLSINRIQHLVV
jgi:glutamate racemase